MERNGRSSLFEEQEVSNNKDMKYRLLILIICIMIVVAILINVPYYKCVRFINMEEIEVFEPIEEIMGDRYKNGAEVMKECRFRVLKEGCNNYLVIPPSRCKFVIRNDDVVSADFGIEIYLKFRDGSDTMMKQKVYIPSGESKDVKLKVSKRLKGYRYYITSPMKAAKEFIDYSKGNPIIMCKKSGHGESTKEYCLVKKKRVFLDLRRERHTILGNILRSLKSESW